MTTSTRMRSTSARPSSIKQGATPLNYNQWSKGATLEPPQQSAYLVTGEKMPTPTKGGAPGGSPAHERLILANLASQLFEHGRIVTTEAKAKRLRPLAEKLITKAKRGDIHARRLVLTTVRDKGVVHTLFTEIAPTWPIVTAAIPGSPRLVRVRATTLRWR